ncbi:hypothetical protein D9M69_514900 [compost metagenome]
MGDGTFEQVCFNAMARTVGGRQLGEVGRRHRCWIPLRDVGTHGGHWQAAVARVLEFLHTQRQSDVTGAGGYRVDCRADRLGAAGAEVFDPGDAYIG